MKALFFLLIISFCTISLSAQKNKNKNQPDLGLKVDSLTQRLSESNRSNEKLLLENETLSTEHEKMQKEVSKLNAELSELRKKIYDQESELNRIKEEIKAKEAAKKAETQTSIQFEASEISFGEIKEGAAVTKIYKLKNIGKKRLMIEKVEGSCGCTVAEWPRYPVEPGENAEIKVSFNSLGKRGVQDKTITVTANTEPAQTFLKIKGTVVAE
jgi:Skp family chaperone for outer membrane proteins